MDDKTLLAREIDTDLIITLLPIERDVTTREELELCEFIADWFWAGLSLPERADFADHFGRHTSESTTNKMLGAIRAKNGLDHTYQIPFLRINGEVEKKVALITPDARHKVAPFNSRRREGLGSHVTDAERAVVTFIKSSFATTLAVPTVKETSKGIKRAEATVNIHMQNIVRKLGLEHGYQIPFIHLS